MLRIWNPCLLTMCLAATLGFGCATSQTAAPETSYSRVRTSVQRSVLRGHIVTEAGQAVEGAVVRAISRDGIEYATVTDVEGVYVLFDLMPGTYEVIAEAGQEAGSSVAQLGERQSLDVSIALSSSQWAQRQ